MLSNKLAFLNATKKGTKEAIIHILTEEWPLSAKEIHKRLEREVTISYQGTHKTLNELEETKVIIKKGKEYALNLSTIDENISTLNKIKQNYSKKVGKMSINKNITTPQVIHFNNYSNMCVAMAEFLASRILLKDNDTHCACTLEYGWWPLRFSFIDYILLAKAAQKNPDSIIIIRKKTPFGEWISKQYKKINLRMAPLGTTVNIAEDIYTLGDYIMEITFSPETKAMFEKYYNKCHNIEDIFKEFGLQNEPEVDITVTITKNPALAKFLKAKLEEVYEKAIDMEAKKTKSTR